MAVRLRAFQPHEVARGATRVVRMRGASTLITDPDTNEERCCLRIFGKGRDRTGLVKLRQNVVHNTFQFFFFLSAQVDPLSAECGRGHF